MSNPSNKEGPLSSAANNELKDKQKRTNQVKVSLNSEELKNLDDLVIRMGSDRSSTFRHLLNLSSQNSLKNEDSRELQSDKETTRGDVLISAVVSSYLLTHLHHVLEKAEYGASKEGRSSHAANFAQLRKVLCMDATRTNDNSSLSSIRFSDSSDKNNNYKRVVHFFEPKSFDEITKVVELIEEGSITILNLKFMDAEQSQRAIDFVNGALFGLKGHQEKIDEGIFVFAPSNTELISNFQEELDTSPNDVSEASISKLISNDSKSTSSSKTVRSNKQSTEKGLVNWAYIDSVCRGNPGPGAWGALIAFVDPNNFIEFGGFNPETTQNRMDLQAAISVFKKLQDFSLSQNVIIKTDSKYLFDGFEKWLNNWKKKDWKTSSGKPVLNQDLWKELDAARIEGVKIRYNKDPAVLISESDLEEKLATKYYNKELLPLQKI